MVSDAGNTPAAAANRPEFLFSVTGLDATFDAIAAVTARWSPQGELDVPAMAQALLIAAGKNPGLWREIDGQATHTIYMADDGKALAGTFVVASPNKLMDALGARPVGPNAWAMDGGEMSLSVQHVGSELRVATSTQALDRAVALREGLTPGPALRVVAKNLRIDEADSPIAGPFSLDLSADLRVDADLQAKIVMEGRVTDVWREFSGPTTTGPTRIEQRLPGGSGFAMVLSIGSTSMFREALAQYRKLRPSTGSETDALFDTLMPGIEALSEVVGPSAGMTLHPARGGMALVVALEVKDGGAASKSLGTIVDAIVAANSATRVERVKVAGVQVHAITSPPSAGSDASASTHPMRVWVFVHRDVAVLVMAPDPRPMAEAIIRPRGPRLADDGGLVRLRALLGGCQTCMTFDPIRTAEASLLAQARNGNKAAAGRAKVLAKRKSHGAVSIGSKFHDDGRGMTVALDVPRSLLFGPTDVAQLVMAGFSGERERERAGGAILRAVTGFGDRTCACKDMDCVMAVQREMTAWAAANRDAQGTEEQATEIAAEGKRMADCVGRIAAASGG